MECFILSPFIIQYSQELSIMMSGVMVMLKDMNSTNQVKVPISQPIFLAWHIEDFGLRWQDVYS